MAGNPSDAPLQENSTVKEYWDLFWEKDTKALCAIPTFRDGTTPDQGMVERMFKCIEYLEGEVQVFNQTLPRYKFSLFQWYGNEHRNNENPHPSVGDVLKEDHWVFGWRVGNPNARKKLTVISHMDVVPAEFSDKWDKDPFTPYVKAKDFEYSLNKRQNFLVARGASDNKGPGMCAFTAIRALAANFQDTRIFENVQVEMMFDAYEETAMSTPAYYINDPSRLPDFGVVHDAGWIHCGEKGNAKDNFTFSPAPSSLDFAKGLHLIHFYTCELNSINTIADWTKAEFGGPPDLLDWFASKVVAQFDNFEFDDPSYRRGELIVEDRTSGGPVVLKIFVQGSQHGSAAAENRKDGVNSLQSLANFLAGLTNQGVLAVNEFSTVARFIAHTWGTYAFGRKDNGLYGFDDIFKEGNGTTYAVTKLDMVDSSPRLGIDTRYSTYHHSTGWDGETEGILEGGSNFEVLYEQIIADFEASSPDGTANVKYVNGNRFGPDVRNPKTNKTFLRLKEAYEATTGLAAPELAVGGGTNAKGNPELIACGPFILVSEEHAPTGPPINFHGFNEGAPMGEMYVSTQALYLALESELKSSVVIDPMKKEERRQKALRAYKILAKGTMGCDH